MDSTLRIIERFAHNENGATAIEYGLLASLLAVGCIIAFQALGTGLFSLFGTTDSGAGGSIRSAADRL
jgi:pilus assembly protein Flp/PilA